MEQEELPQAEWWCQKSSVPQTQAEDLDGRWSCSEMTVLLLDSPLEKQTEGKKVRKKGLQALCFTYSQAKVRKGQVWK